LKKNIKNYDLDKLKEELKNIGEKPFRAEQIFKWIYSEKVTSFDEMTNLSLELRKKLEDLNESLQDYQATIATQFKQTQVDYTFLFNTLVESINNDSQEDLGKNL